MEITQGLRRFLTQKKSHSYDSRVCLAHMRVCVRVRKIACSANLNVKSCCTHHAIQARPPFFPQFGCFSWKVEFEDIAFAKNNYITYENIALLWSSYLTLSSLLYT